MATTRQAERGKVDEEARDGLRLVIGERVIQALGEPGGLHRVQVRHLWGDHYRVNVLVGVDAASATIAHSYFLVTDGAGHILAATPKLSKRY
jgi:hypothetical protein